jgi:UDP-glucose 4-epimerase
MSERKKILVTRGAGYIGSHTVVELIENGYDPIIVDDFRNSSENAIKGISNITGVEVQVFRFDICNENDVRKLFVENKFEGIIHFAAYKSVSESVEEPIKYYENNIGGLITITKLAVEFNVQNFVFSSSCTVYGSPKKSITVDESTSFDVAFSPYGSTKQIGEKILNDIAKSGSNLRILKLRYFNPIGAHASGEIGELPTGIPDNLLPYVMQTASGLRKELTVHGNDYNTNDGTCIRDYIHVVDLASAHVKGIDWLSHQKGGVIEAVNVGTGKGTSVLEIIHIFEDKIKVKLNWKFGPRRPGDVEKINANVEKAERVLNWTSKKSVEQAILDAWKWEQKNSCE